jgi:hypothetical protein
MIEVWVWTHPDVSAWHPDSELYSRSWKDIRGSASVRAKLTTRSGASLQKLGKLAKVSCDIWR